MPQFFRSDQSRVQVTVSGIAMPGDSWQKMEGADNAAETTELLPGGMQPAIALGGIPKRTDLVAQRPWSDALVGIYKQLDMSCGNAVVNATYTVLDANKNPVPNATITYTGVLKGVQRPNYDATSSTEALLQITVALNENIT